MWKTNTHTVYWCARCKRQRAFYSSNGYIYKCATCELEMKYNRKYDRLSLA